MRAGVNDRRWIVMVRQKALFLRASEGELQDSHAGQLEAAPQGIDFRRDDAQVFGHQRQTAQALPTRVEEGGARALRPAPGLRGEAAGGDLPIGLEAAEMIEPDQVHEREQRANTIDPPLKAGLAVRLPLVDGVAPELAGRREVVGRHAGHHLGPPLPIELKQLRVAPDIRRIGRHKDGEVAHQPNASAMGIGPQHLPLAEEEILREAMKVHPRREPPRGAAQGRRATLAPFFRPLLPTRPRALFLQGHEQGVVVQPGGLVSAERQIVGLRSGRGSRLKLVPGQFQ